MGKMKQMLDNYPLVEQLYRSVDNHVNNLANTIIELEEENKKLKKKIVVLTSENSTLKDSLRDCGYEDDNQYSDRQREIDSDLLNLEQEKNQLDDDKS